MKQLFLICAVVVVVGGCEKPLTKEEVAEIRAAADASRAAAEKKSTETATIPQQPKTTSEKLITDPIVEAAIRDRIKKPTGKLTKADLEKVTHLGFGHNKLTKVPKDLEKLTQLVFLFLGNNQLTDVKGLEKLTQLKELYLNGNQLTDVKGLENLTRLASLTLLNNQLTDVKGLEKLTQLTRLNLNSNQLTDVKGLEKLTQLKELYLKHNPDLTKAKIAELQKALPNCKITYDFK